MSEHAPQQTTTDYETLAKGIDDDLRFFAERIPTEVKLGPVGTTAEQHRVTGLGSVEATYLGHVAAGTNPADNFNVRVRIQAEGCGEDVGYYKDYALTYQSVRGIGPVIDKQPTTPEDLADCPVPPEALADTINQLAETYKQLRPL